MKQAVQSSLDLGDINPQSVCKAVGMTKPQLSSWLTTTSPSPHWDAKVAEWLKQAQARALSANGAQHRGASSSVSSKGSGKAAKASQPAKASPSSGASAKAATSRESTPGGKGVQAGGKASTEQSVRRLRQDLLELETYIPWTAVSSARLLRQNSAADVKQSLRYLSTGEIVFTAGMVGVVMNASKRLQRFSCEHVDDIICAVHSYKVGVTKNIAMRFFYAGAALSAPRL